MAAGVAVQLQALADRLAAAVRTCVRHADGVSVVLLVGDRVAVFEIVCSLDDIRHVTGRGGACIKPLRSRVVGAADALGYDAVVLVRGSLTSAIGVRRPT